jgi:ATP-dependent exoDNAse (exonuclease V) alpha subunit
MTFFEATTWLLEQLLSALRLLQERGETSAQMGAKTFGLLPCHEARGNRQAQIATFLPDEDQTRAIEVGIASERLILVGPPVTGKTSVQCALILEHLLAGKTVLLATPTHVALDNAMTILVKRVRAVIYRHSWKVAISISAMAFVGAQRWRES